MTRNLKIYLVILVLAIVALGIVLFYNKAQAPTSSSEALVVGSYSQRNMIYNNPDLNNPVEPKIKRDPTQPPQKPTKVYIAGADTVRLSVATMYQVGANYQNNPANSESYIIDWGDGTKTEGIFKGPVPAKTAIKYWLNTGTYNVVFTAIASKEGVSASATKILQVKVIAGGPSIAVTFPTPGSILKAGSYSNKITWEGENASGILGYTFYLGTTTGAPAIYLGSVSSSQKYFMMYIPTRVSYGTNYQIQMSGTKKYGTVTTEGAISEPFTINAYSSSENTQ